MHPEQTAGLAGMPLSPGDHCHFLLVRGGSAQHPSLTQTGLQQWGPRVPGGGHPKVEAGTLGTAPHLSWLLGLLLENVMWGDGEIRTKGKTHLVLPSLFLVLLSRA